jgi:hypothetical protein
MTKISNRSTLALWTLCAGALALLLGGCATAPPAPSMPPPEEATKSEAAEPVPTGPIAPFAWLAGCWQGNVNQRDFREQWLPLRGDVLVGAGQQESGGRTQDYEYLRIEPRVNGIFFSQFSGDRKETSFRLASTTTEDKDTIFTFVNTTAGFPARLIYRRGVDGWLYETIEGTLNGADKRVIYPMRRVSCETGELILK